MAFQISPGVIISEIDLTNIVPAVATTNAGFVGFFRWGPLNTITLLSNETDLVDLFGKPDADTYEYFLTASSFLSYGRALRLVRVTDEDLAKNATCGVDTSPATITGGKLHAVGVGQLIKNDDHYLTSFAAGEGTDGIFTAKYPGENGNSLKVSICPSDNAYNNANIGLFSGSTALTTAAAGATLLSTLEVGSKVYATISGTREERTVASIQSTTAFTIDSAFSITLAGQTLGQEWEYHDYFSGAPGTSDFSAARGSTNDEIHIVVVDEDGVFSGTPGTILEKYDYASKASDARDSEGQSSYYANVVNRKSEYIRWTDHLADGTNWGAAASGVTTYTAVNNPRTFSLAGGLSANDTATIADLERGIDKFVSAEDVDVSIMIGGPVGSTVANYIIDNVCDVRKDCVVCLSPEKADVVNNYPDEVTDTLAFRDLLSSTSYAVLDNNWKYMYDKYNDCNRWVPCCGDVAGLMVRTDYLRDAWWSPAGFNRGNIKNTVKLAYNATAAQRDDLYAKSINPIVTFSGLGTVLYGDKTLLAKPSAFDRINVRRLFIVLEKAIAIAAKFTLFEFNDEFTRAQFVNMVEPFLRDVQGRRGIIAYKVVCDTSNNPGSVIDRNEFVGDIYIKPAKSINFITLHFVAVGTDVSFNEVVGQF